MYIIITLNIFQIKTEIKDEALDFSSTTLSENHQGDSSSSALSTNNIGEEARMYLDAFARSANLPWQQSAEEATVSPSIPCGTQSLRIADWEFHIDDQNNHSK